MTTTATTADSPPTRTINEHGATILKKAAIPLDYAESIGIYTAVVPEDLPEELDYLINALPGLVYPLRHVDQTITHQFARDNRDKTASGVEPAKYVIPEGSGTWLTVHPNQFDRLQSAPTVLVVEGTKQAICVTNLLRDRDDVVAVGIQGCTGWSSNGSLLPDFEQVGIADRDWIIIFDADRRTNQNVYDAGTGLARHLTLLGAASVKYADNPGGKKSGLDDVLGKMSSKTSRLTFLDRLIETAVDQPGRRPAMQKAAKARTKQPIVCDMASGTSYRLTPGESDGAPPTKEPVADFAARIAESITVEFPSEPDRMTQKIVTLEVAIATEGDGVVSHSVRMRESLMSDIGLVLGQVPGGEQIGRPAPGSPLRAELENAIRACQPEQTLRVTAQPRLGWHIVNGEQRYLHQGGALGADGNVTDYQAYMFGTPRLINYAKASEQARDVIPLRKAVRATIDARKLLIDPTPWIAGLGGIAVSQCGIVPRAAVVNIALNSSGKTLIQMTLSSALTPQFAYKRTVMMTANGTENAIDQSMTGFDNCFLLIDDWAPAKDVAGRARQYESMDRALRRSSGAPSKPRARYDRALDEIVMGERSDSHPLLLLSMEAVPDRRLMESVIDRMLIIFMSRETTFRPGDAVKMAALGQDGAMHLANTGFLMWMAACIREMSWQDGRDVDPEAGMEAWTRQQEERRDELTKIFVSYTKDSTPRGTEVAASLLLGIELWLDYAEYVNAITARESNEIADEIVALFVQALQRHTSLALGGNATATSKVLAALRAAVNRGELVVSKTTPAGTKRRLGRRCTVNGQDVLAIIPDSAFCGFSAEEIERALEPEVIEVKPDTGQKRNRHQVRFAAEVRWDEDEQDWVARGEETRPYCICIPWGLWESGGKDKDDA